MTFNKKIFTKRSIVSLIIMFFLLLILMIVGKFLWLNYSQKSILIKNAIGSEVYYLDKMNKVHVGKLKYVKVRFNSDKVLFYELYFDMSNLGTGLEPWELWRLEVLNRQTEVKE